MTKQSEEKVIDSQTKSQDESDKSPKSVKFILLNIFFERFSSAGITGEPSDKYHRKKSFDISNFSNFGSLSPPKVAL